MFKLFNTPERKLEVVFTRIEAAFEHKRLVELEKFAGEKANAAKNSTEICFTRHISAELAMLASIMMRMRRKRGKRRSTYTLSPLPYPTL